MTDNINRENQQEEKQKTQLTIKINITLCLQLSSIFTKGNTNRFLGDIES